MPREICFPMRVAIIILLLFILSCTSQTADTVKIGALLSLSGPAASYGQESQKGIDLAVEEINTKGGINGKQVEIIYEDDATDSKKAVTAFNKLVEVDNVVALIGGTWDFNYNAIAPLAEEKQITLITPQNVKTDGLTINDYTFLMRPEMRKIVWTLENHIKQKNIKRIAIVHYTSPFGEAILQGLTDIMNRTNGTIVLDQTYTQLGGNDFLTEAAKVKQSGAEAVFLDMLDTDLATFLKRAKETELDVQFISHGIVTTALNNMELDHNLFQNMVYFDYDTPASQEFTKKYRAKYNKTPNYSASGAYDSMMILAEALNSTSPENINEYLAAHKFSTINGEFTFKNNVIDTGEVFVQQVTPEGVETLERIIVH
ncbi:hypothetical protein COV18_02275 [Candidatus Woesearchaeota archaeon CG10_big_fil_rev_8_21_14_0_10_37_12]|nr:MAG: hypothetical protein COV18_02275 [Candidatus Woesearchaeota archaeon CG10_big_fil_rev_8_21_14_0_10_37_12]